MEKKIGFIGCGNMGTAMIQGILESGKCPPQEMMISCRTKKTLEEKKAQFGVQIRRRRAVIITFIPCLARERAMSLPIPELAPVTNAIISCPPFSFRAFLHLPR